ncbi:GRE3 [Candida oxycetoniae]|uniref:GRE3 n=1 Tax=Candida oxycetoniae TaxID=497107 RepID=A0AAI9SZ99_9ASCO|nr:GRE3 [Candida oxycetoniae]KAI3405429.1 GRE3 [Candida oxycetoniae]
MSIKLNSGHEMPLVGFGCWKLENKIAADQVYDAIKTGYRLFDEAQDYGNEKEVGDGIKHAIDDGLTSREELFITSKLWNSYHDPKNVELALDRILSDLKLEYLDLFLIHFPIAQKFVSFDEKYPPGFYCGDGGNFHFENIPLLDTWHAMEKLVEKGKVKSIGISNFNGSLIYDLLRGAKIPPAVLQIEHHPYLQQERLIEWVQSQGIAVTAYSSFGPLSFVELENKKAIDAPKLFEHDTIKRIAANHGKTCAQVLLRWSTQRNIAVIPKSSKQERAIENLEVNKFNLTDDDIKEIKKLDKGLRFNDPWDWNHIPVFI